MSTTGGFRINVSDLSDGLARLDKTMENAIKVYAKTAAKDLESEAKRNRPWTDRTGQARQRLNGYTEDLPNGKGIRIILAHGVDYGIWLELANEKKYAILEPTIRLMGAEIVEGLENLLK